jgi:hypothetical protein
MGASHANLSRKDQKLPETGIAGGQTQIRMSQALKVKDDMKRFLDGFDAQMRQAFSFPHPGMRGFPNLRGF